jgi:dTDP-glucose pyrophosphorylase
MAGAGSRFAQAGYTFPKPLIYVKVKPMIQVVVDNLNIDAKFIYVVQKEHSLVMTQIPQQTQLTQLWV